MSGAMETVRENYADYSSDWAWTAKGYETLRQQAYEEFDEMIREVRAKAIEDAADAFAVVPHPYEGGVTGWLRAHAAAIREGK